MPPARLETRAAAVRSTPPPFMKAGGVEAAEAKDGAAEEEEEGMGGDWTGDGRFWGVATAGGWSWCSTKLWICMDFMSEKDLGHRGQGNALECSWK